MHRARACSEQTHMDLNTEHHKGTVIWSTTWHRRSYGVERGSIERPNRKTLIGINRKHGWRMISTAGSSTKKKRNRAAITRIKAGIVYK